MIEHALLDRILSRVLSLPKLKYIVFADYRLFCTEQDTIKDIRMRLFDGLPLPIHNSTEGNLASALQLRTIFKVADELGVKLQSFTTVKNHLAGRADDMLDMHGLT